MQKKIRFRKDHVHTYADPFLVTHNEALYLFAEIQKIEGLGFINVWQTYDLKNWNDLGTVLKGPFHYSYPFVFHDGQDHYLLPESTQQKGIYLYRFNQFPNSLDHPFLLMNGNYADSSIIKVADTYYLLTTNEDNKQLELFWSGSLLTQDWKKHPASPLSGNDFDNRSGGGLVSFKNRRYRIAQNRSQFYGQGIVIAEVDALDRNEYKERIIDADYKGTEIEHWHQVGRHHLSLALFQGKTVLAMDGLQYDHLLNKAANIIFKFI